MTNTQRVRARLAEIATGHASALLTEALTPKQRAVIVREAKLTAQFITTENALRKDLLSSADYLSGVLESFATRMVELVPYVQ